MALLFAACDRKPQETKTPPPVAYVALRKSEVFHHPRCEWALKILPENAQQFATREEAVAAVKTPCKVCRP